MTSDGFKHEVIDEVIFGNTEIKLFPNELNEYDVDSALCVRTGDHVVVNMNDNLYNADQIEKILKFSKKNPDIALMSYTGAGPYPQTYYSPDEDAVILNKKSIEKKESFFKKYFTMKDHLKPKKTIPFAGKYYLGGNLQYLNKFRGVSDAVEIAVQDKDAIVLEDGGDAKINISFVLNIRLLNIIQNF